MTHISDEELPAGKESQQDGIEAFVEAAQEEGILAQDEAQMIEQVVEFSDKRVLELMTPRPEIVAISADATIEQMRRLLVDTKFSRVIVYRNTLDDILGVADGRDLLQIPEGDAQRRRVRRNRPAGVLRSRNQARLAIAQGDANAANNTWPSPWMNTDWSRAW